MPRRARRGRLRQVAGRERTPPGRPARARTVSPLTITLLAVVLAPAPRVEGASTVAAYDFRPLPNRDFTRPDDWTRVIEPGYPFYIDAELTDQEKATDSRSLVFRLNGGNCAYFSPASPAARAFNYVAQAQIKTDGLVHDKAFFLLEFLDQRKHVVGTQHLSRPIGGTRDWTTVSIGPVAPTDDSVKYLRVACVSQHGTEMDLSGRVFFDDIWIGRLPRIEIVTSGPFRILELGEPIKITARVSGMEERTIDARFFLADENQKPLEEAVRVLEKKSADLALATWEPVIPDVGFFHLDIGLFEGNRKVLREDFPLTVTRRLVGPVQGEFGLSAPAPAHGLDHLERVLDYSASRYLKLPLWGDAVPEDGTDRGGSGRGFARFLERITARGHALVGALDAAPARVELNLPRAPRGIADIFTLPREKWAGDLEGVVARHGLKVTRWQIGGDSDTSFDTLPNVEETVGIVKREMDQIARDLSLGLSWNWLAPPRTDQVSFLALSDAIPEPMDASTPVARTWSPLAAANLREYLALARSPMPASSPVPPIALAGSLVPPPGSRSGTDRTARRVPELWILLAPLAASRFDRETRILDLAERVVAAKVGGGLEGGGGGADAIMVTKLADPDRGLIAADGAPTELYTIWRTLAEHLGGARFLGRLFVPGKNENLVFGREGKATIWIRAEGAAGPSSAELVVGPGARRTDLWGRRVPLPENESTATIEFGRWPVLLTDCSEALARFQLELGFRKGKLPSEFGRQVDELVIGNPFGRTLAGKVSLAFPDDWRARPETAELQIPAGQTFVLPLAFDIPQGAAQGSLLVPLDFEFNTDRRYRFRLLRPYRLGGDEIQLVSGSRLLADGTLEVELRVTNVTAMPLSLECALRAYNHNVVTSFIDRLPPGETAVEQLFLARGAGLIGETMQLEISELGGRRQFSFLIVGGRSIEE